MAIEAQTLADDMYEIIKDGEGKKRYKPGDLIKKMVAKYEAEGVSKKDGKDAIRLLVDADKVVYTYFNGTWLEMPHEEGSSKA